MRKNNISKHIDSHRYSDLDTLIVGVNSRDTLIDNNSLLTQAFPVKLFEEKLLNTTGVIHSRNTTLWGQAVNNGHHRVHKQELLNSGHVMPV